jgi:radical SAM superfamily enzyme YgiQ (UPF0313 family)|tara:strand:- start:87 stop:1574 length:1488 start_codon:yes stop_codon:yes gene_type:complete
MNVLLIRPEFDGAQVSPHLGLGYLSASLKSAGHKVKVLDGLREKIEYDPKDWDLVGLTAMSSYFPELCKEVEKAKSHGLKTIIGGAHIICDPGQSLIDSGADYAAAGEGERTITQLASGKDPNQVEGLYYWEEGKPIKSNPDLSELFKQKVMYTTKIGNQSRNFINNVDDFGEPDWENVDPRSYPQTMPHGTIYKSSPFAPIITTRGCPYSCSYCSAPITAGRKMRYRDPIKIVNEMENLINNYDVKEIQIEDDNFTLKRRHAVGVCEEIIRRKIKLDWSLPNGVRIDKLDPELLKLMKKSGCYFMSLGIESANQRILNIIKKRLDKNLVRNVVTMVKNSGIDAVGFFIIGFPTETKEEIMNTINFACSLDLERASFHKAMPLPGTELYDLWLKKYSKNQNIDWKTFCVDQFNADWAEVSPKELERLHKLAFFKFYFTKFRVIKFLFNLNANQILKFIKRVMAVLLTSKWYNRIFNRSATNIKFINPTVRKVSKN